MEDRDTLPAISLITASFNSAAVIRSAIESVLAQSFADYEYLVIDGGSSDGTIEIVKEYAPRFAGRMRWISEPDKGLYDALNKGIAMARGEVVGTLNADDLFAGPDILRQVVTPFAAPELDCLFGDIGFVATGNTDRVVRYYSSRHFRPWTARLGYMPAHPTFCCRRRQFKRLGSYRTDYRIAADHELLIRFLVRARLRYLYLPLLCQRMRLGGMSTASPHSTLILNRENIRACRENGIYSNLLLQLGKYAFKLPGLLLKTGY